MKRLKTLAMALLATASFIFVGCSDDDDDDNGSNTKVMLDAVADSVMVGAMHYVSGTIESNVDIAKANLMYKVSPDDGKVTLTLTAKEGLTPATKVSLGKLTDGKDYQLAVMFKNGAKGDYIITVGTKDLASNNEAALTIKTKAAAMVAVKDTVTLFNLWTKKDVAVNLKTGAMYKPTSIDAVTGVATFAAADSMGADIVTGKPVVSTRASTVGLTFGTLNTSKFKAITKAEYDAATMPSIMEASAMATEMVTPTLVEGQMYAVQMGLNPDGSMRGCAFIKILKIDNTDATQTTDTAKNLGKIMFEYKLV